MDGGKEKGRATGKLGEKEGRRTGGEELRRKVKDGRVRAKAVRRRVRF